MRHRSYLEKGRRKARRSRFLCHMKLKLQDILAVLVFVAIVLLFALAVSSEVHGDYSYFVSADELRTERWCKVVGEQYTDNGVTVFVSTKDGDMYSFYADSPYGLGTGLWCTFSDSALIDAEKGE